MNLNELSSYLKNTSKKIEITIDRLFNRETWYYLRLLKQYTPKDKGDLSNNWVISKKDLKNRESTISNDLIYMKPIEFGSNIGKKPWPSPGLKTIKSQNKIFSTQAVGGVTQKVITDNNVTTSALHISDNLIKDFK